MFFKKRNNTPTDFSINEIQGILGFTPDSFDLYVLAFLPRQISSDIVQNNERLEYLGDAVLGLVVAHFLFVKYPFKDESFLTDMRSKIVRRDTLNILGQKMGLDTVLNYYFDKSGVKMEGLDNYGNALESLVGAIYIDKKYAFTQQWIEKNILRSSLLDMKEVEEIDSNARNTLHSWVSQQNQNLEFKVERVEAEGGGRQFVAAVVIEGYTVCTSSGMSKKEAINRAVKDAIQKLNI